MKIKKLYATVLAVVMAISTMAMAVPAYAEGDVGDTTVKLTVEEKNQYTMTIPATTTMNADGAATALTNGLKVKGINMTKNVVVTMTGADDWKMSTTGKYTKIGYAVYDTEACAETDKITTVEFSVAELEANDGFGTTKTLYVKPDAADLANAESGEYQGTITFTANLKEAAPCMADLLIPGARCKVSVWATNYMIELTYEKNETGFECVKFMVDSMDYTNSMREKVIAQVVDDHTIKFGVNDNYDLTVNTSTCTYTWWTSEMANAEYRGFAVQPAGSTEFTDITLTPID